MDFINENIIKCLKQEIDAYRDKYAIALQEIKELNYFSKEDNDKLKADNKELYAEINDLKGENIDLINHADFIEQGKIKRVIDTFKSEIKELKAENKQLQNHVDKYGALSYDELQMENSKLIDNNIKLEDKLNRLIKQVSSNSSNSSSTHTHTISGEISEYMDHNDINKAYIFVVDADAVNEDGYIADSHAVSTIQDSNCVSIV